MADVILEVRGDMNRSYRIMFDDSKITRAFAGHQRLDKFLQDVYELPADSKTIISLEVSGPIRIVATATGPDNLAVANKRHFEQNAKANKR